MKEIVRFMWCRQCAVGTGKPQLEVGLTRTGIQVWCKRHEMNVAHLTPDEISAFLAHPPDCECCKAEPRT